MNEKMLVNGALGQLIEKTGDWKSNAQTVINYGNTLLDSKRFRIKTKVQNKKSGDSMTGLSPGYGNVELKTPGRTETEEKTFGFQKDRVGDYRLWKQRPGLISFHHFWKSDDSTQGINDNDPDEYHLGYDPDTLDPQYFAVKRSEVVFRIGWLKFTLFKYYLESIQGKAPAPRRDLGILLGE